MLVSFHAAPHLTRSFWPVVMRNLLVWKKLAGPSLLGNIAEFSNMYSSTFGFLIAVLAMMANCSSEVRRRASPLPMRVPARRIDVDGEPEHCHVQHE